MIQDRAPQNGSPSGRARQTPPRGVPPVRDAYARLKCLIAQNAFRPGQHLMARDLADDLRVSATPVREALIRLSVEGAIEAVPHKGFYTKPLDAAEIAESYELAFMIASHAIRTGLDRERPASPAAASDEPAAPSPGARLETLLDVIAALSGNRQAVALMRGVNDRTRYVRRIADEDAIRAALMSDELGQLEAALAGHDAAGAIAILRRLLLGHGERLAGLVKEANGRAHASSSTEGGGS